MDRSLGSGRGGAVVRVGSCTGAGAEGWAGRGRWAGPKTPALGLALALVWRAAAGEPCVGMSQGCPPAAPETGTVGRISVLWSELGGGWQGPPWARKLLQLHPAVVCPSSHSTSRTHCWARPGTALLQGLSSQADLQEASVWSDERAICI